MKKLITLVAIVMLFSGGTTITKTFSSNQPVKITAVDRLKEIAVSMDTTANKFDHSVSTFQIICK